jgi:hypothetical protein
MISLHFAPRLNSIAIEIVPALTPVAHAVPGPAAHGLAKPTG